METIDLWCLTAWFYLPGYLFSSTESWEVLFKRLTRLYHATAVLLDRTSSLTVGESATKECLKFILFLTIKLTELLIKSLV